MLKFVHDDMKLVEIWLTKAESDDDVFRRKLEPIFAEYKKKKYRVAVFIFWILFIRCTLKKSCLTRGWARFFVF